MVTFQTINRSISPPGGYLNSTASLTNGSTGYMGGATTAVPAPTNAMTGTHKNCGQWYTVRFTAFFQ